MISDENAKILIKALCEYLDEVEAKRHKVIDIFTKHPVIRPDGNIWTPGHHVGCQGYEEFQEIEAWENIFD